MKVAKDLTCSFIIIRPINAQHPNTRIEYHGHYDNSDDASRKSREHRVSGTTKPGRESRSKEKRKSKSRSSSNRRKRLKFCGGTCTVS